MGVRERAAALAAAIVVFIAPAAAGPLHDAARSGDLNQLKSLLDSGSPIEDRDRNEGNTAPFCRALRQRRDCS